jgi:hypothetical protein
MTSMATTKATKLANLRIEEISGVDDPANLLPGYVIMKRKERTGLDGDALKNDLTAVAKNYAMLYSVLVAGLDYFEDAPDTTKAAVNQTLEFLENVLQGNDPETGEKDAAKDESEIGKFTAAIEKLLGRATKSADDRLEVNGGGEPVTEPKPDDEETDVEKEPAAAAGEAEKGGDVAAAVVEALTPTLEKINEDNAATREALESVIDRVAAVEERTAKRTSLVPDVEPDDTAKRKPQGIAAAALAAGGRKITIR